MRSHEQDSADCDSSPMAPLVTYLRLPGPGLRLSVEATVCGERGHWPEPAEAAHGR